MRGVIGKVADVQASLLFDFQVRIFLDRRQISRRRVRHQLAFAGFQLLQAHRRIRGDRKHQIVDQRGRTPVFRVLGIADHSVLLVGHELERASADRCVVQIFLGASGFQRPRIFRRHDRGERHGDIRQERCFGTGQHEFDGVIVNLDDLFDQRGHFHRVVILIGDARDVLVPRVVCRSLALIAEDHVIGVEIARRGEFFIGMPLHALTQLEGVFHTVWRHFPRFCECWLDFGGALFEFNQTVVDRVGRGIEGAACGVGGRIEPLGRGFRAVNEGLGKGRHGGGHRQCGGRNQDAG